MKPAFRPDIRPAAYSLLLLAASTMPVRAVELEYTNRKNTLEWFESARLGIFIHWDPRSNCEKEHRNGEMDMDIRPYAKRMQERAMWGEKNAKSKNLPWQSWNPQKFDAEEWMDTILSSGAKYFTFTTMHAWDFSNFDNPATRFDIMSTPFKRDIPAELAQAAKDKPVAVFWYFNMFPGKHFVSNQARNSYFWSLAEGDLAKSHDWEEFRRAGLHALVTNTEKYGKLAGIWCDGGGTFTKEGAKGFYETMKAVQPWLIFSPRHGHPRMPHDYRVPEQKLPGVNWQTQQEMTMPIESSLWFWALGKKANTKDAEFVIQTLVQTATRDANLAVNISPRGDGAIDPTQKATLAGLGRWVKTYGESIFGTRAGPYAPGLWGGSTRKANKVFLHFTQLSEDGTYALPKLPARIVSSRILGGIDAKLKVSQSGDHLAIAIDPGAAADKSIPDRVVELTLDRDAWKMLPNDLVDVPRPAPLKATASASSENTYQRPSGKPATQSAASVAKTNGHRGEPWSASEPWSKAGADPNPWLMLDLGAVKPFQTIVLKEQHSRIRKFVVEIKDPDSGGWKQIVSGGRLNHLCWRAAKPMRSRFVRIRIPETQGGAPQISEFLVH